MNKWIIIRKGEVVGVFQNRQEGIKHFKEMLKQTLKDLDTQDKTNQYDYMIKFPETIIKPLEERKAYLGL